MSTSPSGDGGEQFPGLRLRDNGHARLVSTPAPPSQDPAGANDLAVSGGLLVAAGETGVALSRDGGASWQRTLRGMRVWSLTRTADGGFAGLGERGDGDQAVSVVVTSRDGMDWHVVRIDGRAGSGPTYGYRMVMSGTRSSAVAIAVPDVVSTAYWSQGGWRSSDGGRTWTALSLRRANSGLTMLSDGRTVYATAPGPRRCVGAVYRSVDAGASWQVLPSSCAPYPLYSVEFLDSDHGYAGGGEPAKFNGSQFVETTNDGGATWQTRWRAGPETGPADDSEIVRVEMLDQRVGWALSGGCTPGANGPCGGNVYRTVDGARSWQRTQVHAVSLAVVDAQHVVAGVVNARTIAVTSDGGQSWQLQGPAAEVQTQSFGGTDGALLWNTSLGMFRSSDAGRSWTTLTAPNADAAQSDSWLAAPPSAVLGAAMFGSGAVNVSTDNGSSWKSASLEPAAAAAGDVQLVTLDIDGHASAVVGPDDPCLSPAQVNTVQSEKPGWSPPTGDTYLDSSSDSGQTWHRAHNLPFAVSGQSAVTSSGSLITVVDSCGNLQISTDSGHTWTAERIGRGSVCTASARATEIWLSCSIGNQMAQWILHSSDRGGHWTASRMPANANVLASYLSAVGPDTALLNSGDGSLWRSSDDGRTWTQNWPRLPGEN